MDGIFLEAFLFLKKSIFFYDKSILDLVIPHFKGYMYPCFREMSFLYKSSSYLSEIVIPLFKGWQSYGHLENP